MGYFEVATGGVFWVAVRAFTRYEYRLGRHEGQGVCKEGVLLGWVGRLTEECQYHKLAWIPMDISYPNK